MNTNEFLRGYICAVCALVRMEGLVTTQAKDLFKAGLGSYNYAKLREIDMPDYDLELIYKHRDELK